MTLFEILPSLGQPRGTSKFTWSCWGDRAQYVDWGGEDNHIASAVIDLDTGLIYCLELYTGEQALRYLETEFREDFIKECQAKDIDPDDAGQGLIYQDIDPVTVLSLLTQLNPGEPINDPT